MSISASSVTLAAWSRSVKSGAGWLGWAFRAGTHLRRRGVHCHGVTVHDISASFLPCCSMLARSLAGNPDSPQAVVFLTSIIDEIVGVATDYADYHAISHWNTSALRSAKPGQWLSGQTSR